MLGNQGVTSVQMGFHTSVLRLIIIRIFWNSELNETWNRMHYLCTMTAAGKVVVYFKHLQHKQLMQQVAGFDIAKNYFFSNLKNSKHRAPTSAAQYLVTFSAREDFRLIENAQKKLLIIISH